MKLVHILLDETGSMSSMRQEAVDGVNDYLDKIADVSGEEDVIVSLTKFDSEGYRSLMTDVPVGEAIRLNDENYLPHAMTNLFDAIGHITNQTAITQKTLLKEHDQVPVLVLIVTDGYENASKEHTRDTINDLIAANEENGWTFMYIGASQDAWQNERAYTGTITASNTMRSMGSEGLTVAMASAGDSYGSWTDAVDKDIRLGNKVASYNIVTDAQREDVADGSDGDVTLNDGSSVSPDVTPTEAAVS